MTFNSHPRNHWFKILKTNSEPIDGSNETWSLPYKQDKGNWSNFTDQPALLENSGHWGRVEGVYGTWLVDNPKHLYRLNPNSKIYVAKWSGTAFRQQAGLIWVPTVQLNREATNLDIKRFGIFRAFQQILD